MALIGHTAYALEEEAVEEIVLDSPVPEFSNKCIECLFASPNNYYCAVDGSCFQSGNDKTAEICGTDSADETYFYINHVGICLKEPINEVIETQCYYDYVNTNDPNSEPEGERTNSWIIVQSPTGNLDT